MSLTSNEYTAKLINKILFAASQDEVKRFIDAAMKALDQNKVNGHIIARFVDKIIRELDSFSPMNKDAQQWSNITTARVLFNRIKQLKSAMANKLNRYASFKTVSICKEFRIESNVTACQEIKKTKPDL